MQYIAVCPCVSRRGRAGPRDRGCHDPRIAIGRDGGRKVPLVRSRSVAAWVVEAAEVEVESPGWQGDRAGDGAGTAGWGEWEDLHAQARSCWEGILTAQHHD